VQNYLLCFWILIGSFGRCFRSLIIKFSIHQWITTGINKFNFFLSLLMYWTFFLSFISRIQTCMLLTYMALKHYMYFSLKKPWFFIKSRGRKEEDVLPPSAYKRRWEDDDVFDLGDTGEPFDEDEDFEEGVEEGIDEDEAFYVDEELFKELFPEDGEDSEVIEWWKWNDEKKSVDKHKSRNKKK